MYGHKEYCYHLKDENNDIVLNDITFDKIYTNVGKTNWITMAELDYCHDLDQNVKTALDALIVKTTKTSYTTDTTTITNDIILNDIAPFEGIHTCYGVPQPLRGLLHRLLKKNPLILYQH